LWRSWEHKEEAASALRLTPKDMLKFKLIDGIIKEPIGGAHLHPEETFAAVKDAILKNLNKLEKIEPEKRIQTRIRKFSKMGEVK
jgi:acetyl-CoA carboxylase carboxyl transferase subunit alpha